MKKLLLGALLIGSAAARSQPIVNSWIMNANGKKASYYATNGAMPPSYTFTNTTDSADALKVCYNADTVWVYSHNMTDNMGKWTNPGNPVAQNYVHRFPRSPVIPASKVISPKVGEIGLLLNGIVIYGLGDAYSWSGTANVQGPQGAGIWNREVGMGEGVSLDTAFGAHPQAQGIYHSHIKPYRLFENVATSQHSPIVGWAFDGYPIYGPYGYSSPMNAGSAVARMKSGYSLRNITTRTTFSAIPGGGGTASQTGPAVNSMYPIGTYCEDYEWLSSNGGDLDQYNGRMCVTPEFPNGTYAYFVTVDAAGKGQFPYYIGINYYGQPDTRNFPAGPGGNTLTMPAGLSSCRLPTGSGVGVANVRGANSVLSIFPNPAPGGRFTIRGNGHSFNYVTVVNTQGQKVYAASLSGQDDHTIQLLVAGVYLVRCENAVTGIASVQRVVVD